MAKHVRIGVVGAGFAAHFHLASYAKVYGEDFEIHGIYGRNRDKSAHLAKEFKIAKVYDTYEQMLADKEIDVCDLVVANYMHIPLAIQAANAGKHAKLLLLAAPAAEPYYPHIGFTHHPQAWMLGPDERVR